MDRKGFLKSIGLGVAAIAVAPSLSIAEEPEVIGEMPKNYEIYVNAIDQTFIDNDVVYCLVPGTDENIMAIYRNKTFTCLDTGAEVYPQFARKLYHAMPTDSTIR